MKALYFDCFAGASGDMILGSLLDSGLELGFLESELEKLPIAGYSLSALKVTKRGISGTSFRVTAVADQPARSYTDIISMIGSSSLDNKIKDNACSIFTILGHAEASVHGVDINEVHFHEIGAVDSIIDICGTAIAMHAAGSTAAYCSAINTGSGTVRAAHGILPVPAPATARLLQGMTIYSSGTMAELATPTGAAILKHYCRESSDMPQMKITAEGYGAGSMDLEFPNMLRLFHGEIAGTGAVTDAVIELETNIDDMNPELFGNLFDSLFVKGALDVTVSPALMKKNRPGHVLRVLAAPETRHELIREIFRETTSSGIRFREISRVVLPRKNIVVETEYGIVSVKVHEYEGETVTVSPEYRDCRTRAAEHNVAVKTVFNAAIAGFYRRF